MREANDSVGTLPSEIGPRPDKYSRWRAVTLVSVYVLMCIHIIHWKLNGKTLAPLELNELMYTMELGIVTAGFIFMVVGLVSVMIFGRFFCSWGCHILALEDLSAWLLKRIRIKPRPIRSRLLLLVPPLALLYMFVWPQVLRLWRGEAMPPWRIVYDAEGWTSFTTNDFWRNLPTPWVTATTFVLCGFAIVYVLGSRSFCRYGCPYGALFGFFDRFAPGKIVVNDKCKQCGTCTSVCQSHVRVHEELKQFGKVVNPECLKDLDCVAACPNDALHWGFTKPSLFDSMKAKGRRLYHYDFSWGEELLIGAMWLATLFVFRGLYDFFPFLMTLGMGGIVGYLTVTGIRLVRRSRLHVFGIDMKQSGRLTAIGTAFAVVLVALAAFTLHSGFIRYHEALGAKAYVEVQQIARTAAVDPDSPAFTRAMAHLGTADRWGLVRPASLSQRLATLHLVTGNVEGAKPYVERLRAIDPAGVHELMADLLTNEGDIAGAVAEYRRALEINGKLVTSRMALAGFLANQGAFHEAIEQLEAALVVEPDSARAHYNLAVMLAQLDRDTEAIGHYNAAAQLSPRDPEVYNNLGFVLARQGQNADAKVQFQRAIELHPDFAHPHFNLGRLLLQEGNMHEAEKELRLAAKLDPQYARLLSQTAPDTAGVP